MGIEVHDLRFIRSGRSAKACNMWLCDYLVGSLRLIDIQVTRDVHVEEIIVQRLACSIIGTIWHIAIIPVVDVLDSLTLIWRMLMPIPMKVALDIYGHIGPTNRRGC
jgi:hypothetical protein